MDTQKKWKICHVITRMIVGGAQENTLFTVVDHAAAGHDVTLVTGHSPGREGVLLDMVEASGFRLEIFPDLVRELDPVHDLCAYFRLKKFFREQKFDIVHTHTSKAGIIGRLAAAAAGIPVVVHTVHGQAFHPYEKPWRNKLFVAAETLAAKKSDRIFAVAQAMIDQCVAAGIAPRERYQVVYSGMDMEMFLKAVPSAELRQQLALPEGKPVIATLARLSPQKGYEYVFPAALQVLQKNPDVHFLLIGDGPMLPDFEKKVRDAGVAEHFHFAGLISPERVPDYLALTDILWHLSLHEGLPRSVVQSMACGNPAIGFRLDGTPEVVLDGRTGYCTAPESVEEVAARTLELLADPEQMKAMGAAGRELVREKFTHQYMADVLENAYQELLERASRKQ